MKIVILPVIFFIFSFATANAQGQPLIRMGSVSISKEDFLKAYKKNNTDAVASEKAIREYLELYIRFKLKVKAAYDARLDTLATQKAELTDFKSQLAASYMIDENSFQALVTEAIARSKKDVHLAHIFIPFPKLPGRMEGDTAFAAKQAKVAYDLLLSGSDFGRVAADFSSDTATRMTNGDLGYITVFTLPYTFENIAYTTPAGTFSKPFKSTLGYHILKNLGERKAAGKVSIAQILLAFEPSPSDSMIMITAARADSIYTALIKGASFNEMVSRYSNDNTSINVHGELPPFGPGTYSQSFENSAFSLTADGEIGKPFRTSFGFHILKRLRLTHDLIDPAVDSSITALKEKIKRDERMEVSRKALLTRIYTAINFKAAPFDKDAFKTTSDSVLQNGNYNALKNFTLQTALFTTGNEKHLMQDWLKYLLDVQNISSLSMGKSLSELYQQFQDNAATEYYREHLDRYNTDYAAQLNEFKEGNLLFEMMQRSIWDRAATDSTGMRNFYNSRKTDYTWDSPVDAIIFTAIDSASAWNLWNELSKKGIGSWRNTMISYLDKAQGDSGRFEKSQLTPGSAALGKPIKSVGVSDVYSFTYIVRMYEEKNVQKTFAEAQGAVLNDYQQYLEEQWISWLKKRYPVVINQSVLKSLW